MPMCFQCQFPLVHAGLEDNDWLLYIILVSCNLLCSIISSRKVFCLFSVFFFINSFTFSILLIMSSAIDCFISSFPICIPFISFFCLTIWAGLSSSVPLFLVYCKFLSWMDIGFCHVLFLYLSVWSYDFFPF